MQIEIMNHLDRSVEFSVAPAGGTEVIATVTIDRDETYTLALSNLPNGTLVYHDVAPESGSDTPPGGVAHGLYGAIVIYGNNEPLVDHDIIVFEDEFTPPITDDNDYFAVLNGKAYPLNPHYIFAVNEVVRFRMITSAASTIPSTSTATSGLMHQAITSTTRSWHRARRSTASSR